MTSPERWLALADIGGAGNRARIDNVIFLSVIVSRIPERQAKQARQIGSRWRWCFASCCSACWCGLIGLTQPVIIVKDLHFRARHHPDRRWDVSDRKGDPEIHAEVEAREAESDDEPKASAFFW